MLARFEAGEGIKTELVRFTEYSQPNDALVNGDIDINSFQHKIFLDTYLQESGNELTIIGDTLLAPLSIFSNQVKSVEEIPEGARIAIPNDPSNSARALFLLQTAGLIKVSGNPGELITTAEITENPKNIEIVELDASQTARALDDVTASAINSGMAIDAGYIPKEDAIFIEPVDDNSKPYVNIVVARPDNAQDPWLNKLVKEYYQTDATAKKLEEVSKGSQIPAWEGAQQ